MSLQTTISNLMNMGLVCERVKFKLNLYHSTLSINNDEEEGS